MEGNRKQVSRLFREGSLFALNTPAVALILYMPLNLCILFY